MKYFVLSILTGLGVGIGLHFLFEPQAAIAQTYGILHEYNEYFEEMVRDYGIRI